MSEIETRVNHSLPCPSDVEAVEHFRRSLAQGKHWYLALLETIGLWRTPREDMDGRTSHYLIAGEAFDWLLLAERLCLEADGAVPDDEKAALLLYGRPPLELTNDQFRHLIGDAKYTAHLNYVYGVDVEEALLLAVEEEVRKERQGWTKGQEEIVFQEAFRRIYGRSHEELWASFCQEKEHSELGTTDLAVLKEFTYWLFKRRLRQGPKPKVASDTRKALKTLHHHRAVQALRRQFKALPDAAPQQIIELKAHRRS